MEMAEKTLDQLAVDMYTRADALPHLMAEAEITRRLAVAQLDAAKATVETAAYTRRNANYLWHLWLWRWLQQSLRRHRHISRIWPPYRSD
jgi:hypothetical protein